ncbi:hypothetical protein DEIPH_ctg025orf0217 [Deinococcus phoenicis]|uniref:Ig-like domain-containing protein n=1 Tax=Deinococcus phoenicis TaxID=1476583 RepID=A0A016QQB2_9DEIO|nr:hypothetical protein [Deinococcus phoenicis]EYB68340.1 hypothetical protein DEIPH_ctg025orf0217 [Deinococcus phoenicis]
MRPASSPLRLLLLACLLTPALSGCRYAYVPLIPKAVEVTLPARVTTAALTREGEALVLRARVEGRFEPGYLSVAWFDGPRDLGRDSVYLDAAQRDATFRLPVPKPGAYRAVISFGGTVLRQVELYEVQP